MHDPLENEPLVIKFSLATSRKLRALKRQMKNATWEQIAEHHYKVMAPAINEERLLEVCKAIEQIFPSERLVAIPREQGGELVDALEAAVFATTPAQRHQVINALKQVRAQAQGVA